MRTIGIIFFLLQLFVTSCATFHCVKSVKPVGSQQNDSIRVNEIAKERFGALFTVEENDTKEFFLAVSRSNELSTTAIKFFIYGKDEQKIIFEDELSLGSVRWESSFKVLVQKFSGTVKIYDADMNKSGYQFDVKSKQKIKD